LSLRPPPIVVPGLREADPTSLLVMTQDLMSRSIVHLDGGTLADLFALSELEAELPRHLHRDLDRFAARNERELRDLPDGAPLREQLAMMAVVPPQRIPERLRRALSSLRGGHPLEAATETALAALERSWAEVAPQRPQVGKRAVAPVERPAVPPRLRMPEEEPERPQGPASKPARVPRPTPAARQDQARSDWIRQHLLARLESRREQGLKESVLVAATCHGSPYTDLQQADVLAELRELRRLGEVRHSAGRWVRVRRLGW